MNNKLSIFLTIIGLIGLLSGCEKDETKVTLSDNTIVPDNWNITQSDPSKDKRN